MELCVTLIYKDERRRFGSRSEAEGKFIRLSATFFSPLESFEQQHFSNLITLLHESNSAVYENCPPIDNGMVVV